MGLYSLYTVQKWLSESGIGFLNEKLFLIELIMVIFFLSITLFSSLYLIYRQKLFLFNIYILSFSGALLSFYFGYNLTTTPNSIFETLYTTWNNKINTYPLMYIEKKHKCCGFRSVHENPLDECNVSSQPCLKRFIKLYSPNIQAGGIAVFLHGVSFCLSILLALIPGGSR